MWPIEFSLLDPWKHVFVIYLHTQIKTSPSDSQPPPNPETGTIPEDNLETQVIILFFYLVKDVVFGCVILFKLLHLFFGLINSIATQTWTETSNSESLEATAPRC